MTNGGTAESQPAPTTLLATIPNGYPALIMRVRLTYPFAQLCPISGEPQPGTHRWAIDHCDDDLWDRAQQQWQLVHPAQTLDPLLKPLGDAARHRLHVPTGTEAAPGAGDDDHPDTGIAAQAL